jgi:hypothetical protein
MFRPWISVAFLGLFFLSLPFQPCRAAAGDPGGGVVVLPFRTIGLSDTTAVVTHDLLEGSLGDLHVPLIHMEGDVENLPSGAEACADADCAASIAHEWGAERVVYGTLSRLGGKIIARLNVLVVGEPEPYYRDQLTAVSEDDLDTVMRRFAEGIAAGRPNSDRATVESVTQTETQTPARRATRSGMGFRAGFLFPTNDSFGGASRLTNLQGIYRYELKDFVIESSTMLGFTWGEGQFDWTILDLGVNRLFSTGDFSPFLGAAVGVHSVTVKRTLAPVTVDYGYGSYTYYPGAQQTETVPTLDLVAGVLGLRTYDFTLIAELRYHIAFENFDKAGGGGAQGIMLRVGTSR